MLPKMLLCIHPTGVPSNKRPRSIWLPWAFFIIAECVCSPMSLNPSVSLSMEEISIRKYQQESGERPFQFTKIKGSNGRVPLHPPSFFPQLKKCLIFLPKDYPISLHCVLRGSPWWSPGLWCCPWWTSLYSGSREPFHSLTDGNKGKNKGAGSASCEHCSEGSGEKEQPWVSCWCGSVSEPFHPTQHPWGTRVRSLKKIFFLILAASG